MRDRHPDPRAKADSALYNAALTYGFYLYQARVRGSWPDHPSREKAERWLLQAVERWVMATRRLAKDPDGESVFDAFDVAEPRGPESFN